MPIPSDQTAAYLAYLDSLEQACCALLDQIAANRASAAGLAEMALRVNELQGVSPATQRGPAARDDALAGDGEPSTATAAAVDNPKERGAGDETDAVTSEELASPPAESAAPAPADGSSQQVLLAYLRGQPAASTFRASSLSDATGLSEPVIRTALRRLMDDNQVRRAERGLYGLANPDS